MSQYILFALIGLGSGVIYAAVGLGVVVTYRGTGVINFATGTMAMWGAYVFDEIRKSGDVVFPVVVIPHRLHLADHVPFPVAFAVAVASCGAIGMAVHFLVFRPLRSAPVLAKVVASVGILLVIQSLVVLQFGSTPRSVDGVLPGQSITWGGVSFPRDRLWLTLIVVIFGVGLWAFFKFTRVGLAIRASAENERAVSLARYSPQLLAASTWAISSVAVGMIVILSAPTTVLNPFTYTFAVVPALAAALIGRLQSVSITVAAALGLGAFQSVIQFQTSKPWWPRWAVTGASDALPFIVIGIALFVVGKSLPSRGAVKSDPLPDVIRPQNRPRVVVALVAVGFLAMMLLHGSYRFGLITSFIVSMIMLSFVVLTGLVGQISLAQAAIAGTAGFALSKFASDAGIPFPISLILATLVAVACGIIIGVPALRIRGAQLAVVTLAGAVALERFIFRNSSFSSISGNLIPDAKLFGINFAVQEGRNIARLQFGLLVLGVLSLLCLAVANLARSATGRRFLAVRSNERAAASVGINVASTKLLAFAMASFLAGIGGSFIGYSRGQLSADSFATLVGVSFLAFAYLGGITSVSGALIAGFSAPLGLIYVFVDRTFNLGKTYSLIAGVGLVLTALFNPVGIAGATRAKLGPLAASLAARLRPKQSTAPTVEMKSETSIAPSTARTSARHVSPDAEVVLEARGITVRFGGLIAVSAVDLSVRRGQIVGLIGPNGAGKTTFIDAMTGFVPCEGAIRFAGARLNELGPYDRARLGLRRTWQSVEIFDDLSVIENLRVATEAASVRSVTLDIFRPRRRVDTSSVERALGIVGLTEKSDARPSTLSLGEQKLVGVARALAARPTVMMLDEPAAGLDTSEGEVLGRKLLDITDDGTAVFLIDHDMGLVLNVCDYIYVLDFGRVIAEGSPADIRSNPHVIAAYLGDDEP
jgi:ABC-type branched-subunit amino acid transport system ATPase component/branched-subunit amino acid ABC-type transport system permease component